MRTIGTYMALAGVISSVLLLLDRNLTILMWIDNWGETTGWVIRIGLIVVGLVLLFLGKGDEEEEVEQALKSES